MKKIIFIAGLIYYFLFPTNVFAAMSVSVNCPAGAPPGQGITCTINGSSDSELLKSVSASIEYSTNIEFVSITNENGWSEVSTKNNLLASHSEGYTGSKVIATIQLKLKESEVANASVKLSNILITDSNSNEVPFSPIIKTIKVYSTNNNLASLMVDDVSVSNFNTATITYNLASTTKASIKVGATAADSNATFVTGFGPRTVNLVYGNNVIQVKVKAEDGTIKVYTLNVVRNDNRSSDNNLKALSITGGTVNFKPGTLKYDILVDRDSAQIDATLADSKASFVTGFGPRTVNLTYEPKTFEIKVKAENGDIRIYTLNISKEDKRSKDTSLKSISLSKGKIDFKPSIYSYSVIVEYGITKIDISAITSDDKATIKVTGGDNLVVGSNIVNIDVTAENGDKKAYTINITRLNENEKVPTPNLNNIKIQGYNLSFDNNKLEYNLKIKNEDILNIEVFPTDSRTTTMIHGNDNLKNGSVIYIVSISSDGKFKEFIINIEKTEFPLMMILIGIGTIIITSLFWIVMMNFKKRKTNDVDNKPIVKKELIDNKEKLKTKEETKVDPIEEIETIDDVKSLDDIESIIKKDEIKVIKLTVSKEEPIVPVETDIENDKVEEHKNKFFPVDDHFEDKEEPVIAPEEIKPTKNIPGKICPNCKMVNDLQNKTCFFCKTELND